LELSTQHGDPLRGTFFTLVHLCAFHPIATTHLIYVLSMLANDTHIVGPTSNVISCFFMTVVGVLNIRDFNAMNEVCNMVSQGLDHSLSFLLNFFILNVGFYILGASVGSILFIDSFVVEDFHEDLATIFSLSMLACGS
jgi:hypothetical protein